VDLTDMKDRVALPRAQAADAHHHRAFPPVVPHDPCAAAEEAVGVVLRVCVAVAQFVAGVAGASAQEIASSPATVEAIERRSAEQPIAAPPAVSIESGEREDRRRLQPHPVATVTEGHPGHPETGRPPADDRVLVDPATLCARNHERRLPIVMDGDARRKSGRACFGTAITDHHIVDFPRLGVDAHAVTDVSSDKGVEQFVRADRDGCGNGGHGQRQQHDARAAQQARKHPHRIGSSAGGLRRTGVA
jgi:hypothetical protein